MSEFKVEPIPSHAAAKNHGLSTRVMVAVRAAGDGNCVVVPLSGVDALNNLRSNLYGNRMLQPGEKIHVNGDATGKYVRVWISKNETHSA